MTVKLWARSFQLKGRALLYCAKTGEFGEYADEASITPVNAEIIPNSIREQLQRAEPDVAEFRGVFYLRTAQGRGWNTPEVEYFRGMDRDQKLQVTDVPPQVRTAFGDLKDPKATPDGFEDSDIFPPQEPQYRGLGSDEKR